jgi:hypothetical protein
VKSCFVTRKCSFNTFYKECIGFQVVFKYAAIIELLNDCDSFVVCAKDVKQNSIFLFGIVKASAAFSFFHCEMVGHISG